MAQKRKNHLGKNKELWNRFRKFASRNIVGILAVIVALLAWLVPIGKPEQQKPIPIHIIFVQPVCQMSPDRNLVFIVVVEPVH